MRDQQEQPDGDQTQMHGAKPQSAPWQNACLYRACPAVLWLVTAIDHLGLPPR